MRKILLLTGTILLSLAFLANVAVAECPDHEIAICHWYDAYYEDSLEPGACYLFCEVYVGSCLNCGEIEHEIRMAQLSHTYEWISSDARRCTRCNYIDYVPVEAR